MVNLFYHVVVEVISCMFLNVVVDAEDPVDSVMFTLDGVVVKTENFAPYAMGGDNGGDYFPLVLPTGFHIIEATGYTGPDGAYYYPS